MRYETELSEFFSYIMITNEYRKILILFQSILRKYITTSCISLYTNDDSTENNNNAFRIIVCMYIYAE